MRSVIGPWGIANCRSVNMGHAFHFEVITSLNGLEDCHRAWDALLDDSLTQSVFLSHEWLLPWFKSFGPAIGDPFVIVIKRNDDVCGICPLILRDVSLYGIRLRTLVSPTNYHTPKFDFLLKDDAESLVDALVEFLNQKLAWHLLRLSYVPEQSRTLEGLRRMHARNRIILRHETGMSSPYLEIDTDFPTYYQALSKKFRQNNDYALRAIGKLGPLTFEEVRDGVTLSQELKEGFAIERSSWKGDAGSAVLSRLAEWGFYQEVAARAAARNWLRLYFAKVGERRVAFDYCLAYKDTISGLKAAYDPEFRKYSPSTLLNRWKLEQLFSSGRIKTYDMLGTASEWKLRWTNSVAHVQDINVFPCTFLGRFVFELNFGLKDRLKRYPWVVQLAASLRRKRGA